MMVSMNDLIALTRGRWFIPILAEMQAGGGSRAAVLQNRLGLSRSMLRRSLDQMLAAGWIMPNPGHGHPLRPEYLVAPAAVPIAAAAARIVAARTALGHPPTGLGRWHLPLLAALASGADRFSDLETALQPITPRALSTALKRAVAVGHVTRRVEASYPPVTAYAVIDRARPLSDAAKRLIAA